MMQKGIHVLVMMTVSISVFFISSCNHNKPYAKYHLLTDDTVDVMYEVFDSTGKLVEVFYEKNKLRHGSNTEYYYSGLKKVEGNWIKGLRAGWFKYYYPNGNLQVLRQYIKVEDTANWKDSNAYLNQVIRFSENGDTLKQGSFYMKLLTSGNNIKNGNEFAFKVCLMAAQFKYMRIILGDFGDNYKLPYGATCDTFIVENYQRAFSPKQYHLGENIIRGKIENFRVNSNASGGNNTTTATIYFTTKFYVSE